jgi:hypothetical protein
MEGDVILGNLIHKLSVFAVFPVLLLISTTALASDASFTLTKNYYAVDKVYNVMDAAPYIKDGRFFVPVRYTALVCGIGQKNIIFDSTTQSIKLVTDGNKEILLHAGDKQLTVDGSVSSMDVSPEIVNGRTYLPIRYIAEAMQRKVSWDAKAMTVTVEMEDYLAKALEEIKAQKYPAAIALCDKIIEISPNSSTSHVIRGVAQFQQANYEGAISSYNQAATINPNNQWAYICRAEARWPLFLKKKDVSITLNMIINDVSHAIEINSGEQSFYYRRAGLYNYKGNYNLAIEDCNKAISLGDQFKEAYYRRAIAYCLKDGNDAFKKELNAILEKFPGDEWATRGLELVNSGTKFQLDVTDW